MTLNHMHKAVDMTLVDWFATFAPEPTKEEIEYECNKDKLANPHGYDNKPKRRSVLEIKCQLRYEYARAMMTCKGDDGREYE